MKRESLIAWDGEDHTWRTVGLTDFVGSPSHKMVLFRMVHVGYCPGFHTFAREMEAGRGLPDDEIAGIVNIVE